MSFPGKYFFRCAVWTCLMPKPGRSRSRKNHERSTKTLLGHVRQGCLGDLVGFNYYYYNTTLTGKSQLTYEGDKSEPGLAHACQTNASGTLHIPLLATLLLTMFIHRWNIDRVVERGLLPEARGIRRINITSQRRCSRYPKMCLHLPADYIRADPTQKT